MTLAVQTPATFLQNYFWHEQMTNQIAKKYCTSS